MEWNIAGAVVLSGLIIVFAILTILIGMVTLMGKFSGQGATPAKSPAPPVPVVQKAAPPPVTPKVQAGISEETVAVISAAVAATMAADSPGVPYTVTGIQRAPGRPVWGFAGMQRNTRPF